LDYKEKKSFKKILGSEKILPVEEGAGFNGG